jgi:hypothetical protein
MRSLAVFALFFAVSGAQALEPPKPKLGPEAVPIFQETDYLRSAPAPDYWTLSAYYVPQATSTDCSAASIAMAVNALRGLPPNADQELVTEDSLLEDVDDEAWISEVEEDGPGVTFKETRQYLRESLDQFELKAATVTAVAPQVADAAALDAFRKALADNEASGKNVMLVYYNQGAVTGDWDGPHISPVGAYDAAKDRVLIMDVDRDWYVPYWTSSKTLLAALVKPAPAEQGALAGQTGGYIVVAKP